MHMRDICAGTEIKYIVLSALVTLASMVNAELLENGDFEDTAGWGDWSDPVSAAPLGWLDAESGAYDENAAVQQSGVNAICGAGTSALLEEIDRGGVIRQLLAAESGPEFSFSMDFAAEEPGSKTQNRALTFTLYGATETNELGSATLIGRISAGENGGNLEFYNGFGWQVALADAVVWDADVTTAPKTHHLTVEWFAATGVGAPYINVQIIDSNGIVHSADGLTDMWRNYRKATLPKSFQHLSAIEFRRNSVSALALIDNLSLAVLPQTSRPAEPALLGNETQLFVDDHLIASMSGVERRVHACTKLSAPVLEAETEWEISRGNDDRRIYIYGTVLRDPVGGRFRMWYMGYYSTLLYATSTDGIDWERPDLGLVEYKGSQENNILPIRMHSPSIIRDEQEPDPAKRYKMLGFRKGNPRGFHAAYSADGINWTSYRDEPVLTVKKGYAGDTGTLAQDPDTGEYLAFYKLTHHLDGGGRLVFMSVSDDMVNWSEPVLVMAPDELDHARTRELEGGRRSEFYNMSAFPYGSQWLGMVTHFQWTGRPKSKGTGQSSYDGPIDVQLVHSRDGRLWNRCSDRSPVIPNGPYDYDAGCILGLANAPVVVDDELWIYYTAITTTHGGYLPEKEISIALAKWRLDGFVSLDADEKPGIVETVPLCFERDRLFVNADASEGSLVVEVVDATGNPLPGYTRENCVLVRGDSIRHRIEWAEHKSLPAKQPVRLRFHLENAKLYSYRVKE